MASRSRNGKSANDEHHHTKSTHRSYKEDRASVENAHHEKAGNMKLSSSHKHDRKHNHEHHSHQHGEEIHANDEGIAESHSHEKGDHSTGHNKRIHHPS